MIEPMNLEANPRILLAATGYSELGMYQDAWDELESLPAEERAAPEVSLLRLAIFVGMKRWDSAAVLAESMAAKGCHDADVYIPGAYAIRRCRTLQEARVFLLAGERQNPKCAGICYNLACYAAQLGELAEAKSRLEKVFKLQPDYRAMALEDEDLEPVWDSL